MEKMLLLLGRESIPVTFTLAAAVGAVSGFALLSLAVFSLVESHSAACCCTQQFCSHQGADCSQRGWEKRLRPPSTWGSHVEQLLCGNTALFLSVWLLLNIKTT